MPLVEADPLVPAGPTNVNVVAVGVREVVHTPFIPVRPAVVTPLIVNALPAPDIPCAISVVIVQIRDSD